MWGICTVIYTSQKSNINNQETSGHGIQMQLFEVNEPLTSIPCGPL